MEFFDESRFALSGLNYPPNFRQISGVILAKLVTNPFLLFQEHFSVVFLAFFCQNSLHA